MSDFVPLNAIRSMNDPKGQRVLVRRSAVVQVERSETMVGMDPLVFAYVVVAGASQDLRVLDDELLEELLSGPPEPTMTMTAKKAAGLVEHRMLKNLADDLLDPERLGLRATPEIRDAARKALGMRSPVESLPGAPKENAAAAVDLDLWAKLRVGDVVEHRGSRGKIVAFLGNGVAELAFGPAYRAEARLEECKLVGPERS